MLSRELEDRALRRRFTRRALLLGAGQTAVLGFVGLRLFRLQVLEGARYAPMAEDNRINVQALAPPRGRILDRRGEVLAANRDGYRAVLVPALAGDVREVLSLFTRIVPIPAAEQDRIVVRARRQSRNLPVLLAADLSFEQVAEINLFAPQLPGVRTELDRRRQYFHGRAVGHVVGYVGAVERHALDDDPMLRLPGARVGKAGVELGLETELRGVAGHVKHEVDVRGRIVRDLERQEPVRGPDVTLTIDAALQSKVLERMSKEPRAALVAIDVQTGDVAVMASAPQFDTSAFSDPLASRILRRLQTAQHHPMVNRAIRGAYPPGSTFKMVTALAALDSGVVKPRERIACDGRYEYAGQTFRCWKRRGHDQSDLVKALRESCDVYFYELARRTGIDAIARMARRLGLGEIFPCGIALQKPGVVPTPDWKQTRFGRPWLGGETILAGIGQGYVLSTPLQLAVMTARLATGQVVMPTLIRRSGDARAPQAPLDIAQPWLDLVRRGMFSVVNEEGGTGQSARLEDTMARMAGKTGTSQVSRASAERAHSELRWEERDHALFVGFAPFARPRYAVAAVIEHAGSGGQSAAPLVRDVMEELLERDAGERHPGHGAGEGGEGVGAGRGRRA